MFKIIDAIEGLKELSNESVDLIITDPPYSSLEKWRNMGTTTRLKNSKASSNEWFPVVQNDYFDEFFKECFRVLKKGTHFYILCDEDTADVLKPKLRDTGFNLRKSLIWQKVGKRESTQICPKCGEEEIPVYKPGAPGMGYPYRSCYEMILLAEKGKRKPPKDKSVRNVIQAPWIKSKKAYPTEKPVELLQTLIKQSSFEGDLVLDPFAGSGSTGVAAIELWRKCLLFDIQEKAKQHFNKSLGFGRFGTQR